MGDRSEEGGEEEQEEVIAGLPPAHTIYPPPHRYQ